MPTASFHFPKGFLWGTATAAHQVEGNNTNNNWWKWEQEGHTADKSGLACDWWSGRWKEDFDRAAEAGQNAHRLSIEWSRIQPTPDRWDEDALDHYRAMLRGLRDRNMTAMVTLHHFTDPLWLAEIGSWETEAVLPLFEKFVRKTVEALKEYCTLWCTINEPNIYALESYADKKFPPGLSDLRLAMRVESNLLRGHAAAIATAALTVGRDIVFQTSHRLPPRQNDIGQTSLRSNACLIVLTRGSSGNFQVDFA